MRRYTAVIAILICSVLALPGPAKAALRKGYLRLGFDSTLFRFGLSNYNPGQGDDDNITSVTVGAAMPNTGAVVGYTVTNGLVIGARVNVGIAGSDAYFVKDHYVSWALNPYLEYVFLREIVRPFLSVQLGAEGLVSYQSDDTWWWGFNFAGGGGVHFFLHQNVSVDLALYPGFSIGNGEMGAPPPAKATKFKHWRFTVAIPLGVSGWF